MLLKRRSERAALRRNDFVDFPVAKEFTHSVIRIGSGALVGRRIHSSYNIERPGVIRHRVIPESVHCFVDAPAEPAGPGEGSESVANDIALDHENDVLGDVGGEVGGTGRTGYNPGARPAPMVSGTRRRVKNE